MLFFSILAMATERTKRARNEAHSIVQNDHVSEVQPVQTNLVCIPFALFPMSFSHHHMARFQLKYDVSDTAAMRQQAGSAPQPCV